MSNIDHKPFFRRFQAQDPVALKTSIDASYSLLEQARKAGDEFTELVTMNRLGFELYVIGREMEAIEVLEAALLLSRRLENRSTEIEVLLSLATARQYLYQHDVAQMAFEEALTLSRTYDVQEFVHFILHHRGRCHVEQGDLSAAKICFEQALRLREKSGNTSLIASTRMALADIATS